MAKNPNPRRALMLGSVAMRSLSTATMTNVEPTARIASPSSSSSSSSLYRRLSALASNRDGTVAKVLDGWVMEGNSINKNQIISFIKELRKYKRFRHALEEIDKSQLQSWKVLILIVTNC
ncbi:pentatricopeptide repeat-containing protein, mitochondrial-like protein [Cinnamomum micranthum f. kanehirae]|uniref:Pentatricopeptide repeat-containing protein, mitochondrial-like protein n=1 Tax=Cinnamomum micranthum f. kanehirae TaxID=337451 RepID=A0A443PWT5_9MAGN|nr:pentatricopeptide repeat-containing protein, mitochondrial-like protein [Cinnamomum micranthum f. kanehirae]